MSVEKIEIQQYRPTYWSVDKSIICSAIAVIKSGLDYAESALVEHDSALGRTTRKNRTWAETIEGDIREMKKVLTQLGALPEPLLGKTPNTMTPEQRTELHKYLDSGEQMPMRSLVQSALDASEKSDSLAAENATLRNAQKACETCDAITMKEVAELRAELDKFKAIAIHPCGRGHLVESAAYWFNRSRKHQELGEPNCAVMAMENAYNHAENALLQARDQLAARKDGERLKQVYNEAKAVAAITPRPPNAITWEQGVKILDVVQLTLCPAIDAAIQSEGKL